MSDDVTLIAVGLFQLAFGVFLGWLRWGRLPAAGVIRVPREQLARIDSREDVPPGLAELVATCGVEVVEATPEEWAVIQRKLDAEDRAEAEASRRAFDDASDAEARHGLTLGLTDSERLSLHRASGA